MSALLPSAFRYVRMALGRSEVSGDAERRYVRITQAMFTGLVGKGVAVLVSLLSVPLTVRYLGAERYGAWVTISTAIAWIAIADLGLSSSLTNMVSEGYAQGRQDLARDHVAAAFWSLAGLAALLSLVFFSVWRIVPWDRVFNVQSVVAREEVGPAIAIAFALFALNFPFSIVAKVYGGYQEVAIANGWAAGGSLLGLAGLVVVTQLKGNLSSLVIAVSGTVLLVNVTSAVWLFGWSKPWLLPDPRRVTWTAIHKLTTLGGMFFVIQIAALILFQTDNLIIAHYLGAAAVTPYSVTWRLFTYTMLFQLLAGSSYWPAYTEAFTRGDLSWVRRSFRMNFNITLASTFALALPLILFGRWIIQKWAGAVAVPTNSLLLWMGAWSLINGTMTSQSCLLASSGRVRGQAIYSMVAAAVNLILSIVLVQKLGLTGVIMGTVGAFLLCVVVPQTVEVTNAIRA
jgi:O-antigen/teichoic acid export membrane protein